MFAPAHLQGASILGRYPRIRTTQHIDEGLEGRIITRLHDRLERKERGSQARARTRHGKLRGKGNTRTRKCIMQARVCIGSAGTANEHIRILDAVFLVHAAHETRDHVACDMRTVSLAHTHVALRPNAALAREKALSQGKELVVFWQSTRVDVEMLLNDGN